MRTVNATRKSFRKTLSVPNDLRSPFDSPLSLGEVIVADGSSDPWSRPRKNRTAPPTSPVVYNKRPIRRHMLNKTWYGTGKRFANLMDAQYQA